MKTADSTQLEMHAVGEEGDNDLDGDVAMEKEIIDVEQNWGGGMKIKFRNVLRRKVLLDLRWTHHLEWVRAPSQEGEGRCPCRQFWKPSNKVILETRKGIWS